MTASLTLLRQGGPYKLLLQAIGAVAGAYLVQHLEPHNLQFAIATSLLVVFILMVCPLAKLLKRFQEAQARRNGAREPLLPGNSREGGSLWVPLPVLNLYQPHNLPSSWSETACKRCRSTAPV